MDHATITDTESAQSTMTRRLFAGVGLAALATAGLTFPAMAQGLKDVDNDDDQNDRDDDEESGDIPESQEEIGITSEFTYESPQFGFTIEWEEPWMVDDDAPGDTDPAVRMDTFQLLWRPGAEESVGATMVGMPAQREGIHAYHEQLMTREGRMDWFGDKLDSDLLLTKDDDISIEILLRMWWVSDPEIDTLMYLQATEVTPDVWVLTSMASSDALMEEAFTGMKDQLFLNGESIVRVTTWRDIERAIS